MTVDTHTQKKQQAFQRRKIIHGANLINMTNSQAFIASISQDAHGLCHGQGQIRQSITCECVCVCIAVCVSTFT